jgi:hypothetical protein
MRRVLSLAGVVLASAPLPGGASYWSLERDGARLLATGTATQGADCTWATVDAVTLRVAARATDDCSRPTVSAHSVVPVVVRSPNSFEQRMRIARTDPRTHRISYGPVVMRFDEASDTHLEWTYGPGSLWLFDTATPRGALVLRVSTSTGRVEDAVPMPRIFRPLLAADDDGLWLAIATNGGAPGLGPAPLFRVAPGARTATLVHRGGRAALWLAAAGHTVWTDVVSGTTRQEIWRFDGPSGAARALARADTLQASAVAVDPAHGMLWTVSGCARVLTIDARSGRQTVVARLHVSQQRCYALAGSPQSATFAFGSFYFLLGERVYRVRP